MKKILLILLLIVGAGSWVKAQDGQRLEAYKIAYLTKKLNLSPEEAQRFWPVYNKYTEDIRSIRQDQKDKNLTEIDMEEKILGVRKKYNGEFSKAISAEKVNTFFRSEKDFKVEIQRVLQERRMNRQQNKRGLRN
ncbi:MAG: hypothetical protein ABIU63_17470 [Chitinophagaceae bacterium]